MWHSTEAPGYHGEKGRRTADNRKRNEEYCNFIKDVSTNVRPLYFIITSDGRLRNHDCCGNIQATTPLLPKRQEKTIEERILKKPMMTAIRLYEDEKPRRTDTGTVCLLFLSDEDDYYR